MTARTGELIAFGAAEAPAATISRPEPKRMNARKKTISEARPVRASRAAAPLVPTMAPSTPPKRPKKSAYLGRSRVVVV